MTVFFHELKRDKLSLAIWTIALSFLLGVCIIIYPEMTSQMEEFSDMFANMGAFTQAFGMDKLNFGEFIGYFGIECSNSIGIGASLFAALLGIGALCKEEKEHTADFLLSHPISRTKLITEKLLSVYFRILILNTIVICISLACITLIGENADMGKIALIFLSHFLLQIEIASITFGISAFLNGNGLGIGIGLPLGFYFLNIVSNLSDQTEFLKYITPFSYTDSSYIISENKLQIKYLIFGLIFTLAAIGLAYKKYNSKDIT